MMVGTRIVRKRRGVTTRKIKKRVCYNQGKKGLLATKIPKFSSCHEKGHAYAHQSSPYPSQLAWGYNGWEAFTVSYDNDRSRLVRRDIETGYIDVPLKQDPDGLILATMGMGNHGRQASIENSVSEDTELTVSDTAQLLKEASHKVHRTYNYNVVSEKSLHCALVAEETTHKNNALKVHAGSLSASESEEVKLPMKDLQPCDQAIDRKIPMIGHACASSCAAVTHKSSLQHFCSAATNAQRELQSYNINVEDKPYICNTSNGEDQKCLSHVQTAQKAPSQDTSQLKSIGRLTVLTTVMGYNVKPLYARILASIFSKYGDIGANCSLVSVSLRSLYMQLLCDIVQKLSKTSIVGITESELADMLQYACDIESVGIEVGWLKERLHEVDEAKKAIPLLRSTSSLKQLHSESRSRVQRMKMELEAYERDLVTREAETEELRQKIYDTRSDISVAEEEVMKTKKIISQSEEKLKHIMLLGSLAHGLLEV